MGQNCKAAALDCTTAMDRGSRKQTNFQRNLRHACESFGTIAEFCRASEINRQQFNKYLAGSATPSLGTLKKICSVLNISTDTLFADSNPPPHPDEAGVVALRKLLSLPEKIILSPDMFSGGPYYCFMSIPERPDILVKSLLVIMNKGSHQKFVRLTIIHTDSDPSSPLVTGRHSGIVCANETEIFLLGANRYMPYQMSLMTLDKSSGAGRGFYTGKLLTRVARSQACTDVHIQPIGRQVSAREAIKNIGMAKKSDMSQGAMILSGQSG